MKPEEARKVVLGSSKSFWERESSQKTIGSVIDMLEDEFPPEQRKDSEGGVGQGFDIGEERMNVNEFIQALLVLNPLAIAYAKNVLGVIDDV